MRKVVFILILINFIIACEESDSIKEIELVKETYPTTIKKIDPDKLQQIRYEYHQTNYFVATSLNQFGFCDCCEDFGPAYGASPPPVLSELSEAKALEIVEDFLELNKEYTGINNISDVTFIKKEFEILRGNLFWRFKISEQVIDSMQVLYSRINIIVENGKVSWCVGNWYPNVYIPEEFNFKQEDAKASLLNKDITLYDCWGGERCETITAELLKESMVRLVITPQTTEDEIELRLSWEIYIPFPVGEFFYFDVMEGKI